MARTVRITLAEAAGSEPDIDLAIVEATTAADIERHKIEDGETPGSFAGLPHAVLPAALVRKQLGMTQPAFASLIGLPVATLRNWEQGRVAPDAAARALLTILAREPKAALRALRAAA